MLKCTGTRDVVADVLDEVADVLDEAVDEVNVHKMM